MKSGYEALTWVTDKDKKQYVCTLDNSRSINSFDELSDEEKAKCSDVNQIVGTERW